MVAGIRRACPLASVEVFDWTTGKWFRLLEHLCALGRNRRAADVLAEHIRCRRCSHLDQPIVLVGHSSGGALIVMALELLPEDCRVYQAILIAPGLTPTYCLAGALARTDHGMDVYHSPLDCMVIGVGTVCLGTMDRKRSLSAGMVGFRMPPGLDDQGKCCIVAGCGSIATGQVPQGVSAGIFPVPHRALWRRSWAQRWYAEPGASCGESGTTVSAARHTS